MLISKIEVKGVHANATKICTMTTGMVGAKVQFTFDSCWDGLSKTAVFRCMDITIDVLNIDSEVTIPHEVLVRSGSPLYVGVYGTNADGDLVIPTRWATVGIVYSGADPSGDPSTERSPDVWEQLQAQINKLREQGVDDATIAAAIEKWLEENPIEGAEVPDALPNPHKLTFTGAVEAEYDGSKELTVEIPEGGGGGIEVTGAEVGQTIVVKAVDENGKPTEWEAADFPESGGSGGGVATETLVASYTHSGNLEVAVSSIDYATGTITAEGHGLSENNMIFATLNWDVNNLENPEKWLPTGMLYGSLYYAVNVTADTFQISTTESGTVATLSTKGSSDFSKWHFERDTDKYGSSIKLKNLEALTNFAVRIFGKSLKPASFYANLSGFGNCYFSADIDGINSTNCYIGVGNGQSGDILLDVKSKVQYDKTLGRYVIDREGFRVANKKGSNYAVEANALDCRGVTTMLTSIEVSYMNFWNCYPANGTIVEVYKL